MPIDDYLKHAINAAQEAGSFLKSHFQSPHQITHKSHINDLVTECDTKSELMIKTRLKNAFPNSSFLCEESGSEIFQGDLLWVIDPLDGTVNFAKKIPFFCVSIALLIKGELSIGVIYNPMTDELFFTKKDEGAFLNNEKIHVSSQTDIKKAFGATGFPYLVHNNVEASLHPIRELLKQGVPLRRLGSAALDIAYTACGRFDMFFEAYLEAWDYSAGALLIKEAGGIITDFQNKPLFYKTNSSVLATNKHLHATMLKAVKI